MSRVCEMCGKGPIAGRSIVRRGLAKSKGGVGKKITGITHRRFLPNLQNIMINIKGSNKSAKVCARCIKSGTVQKAY